jgi:hypothetical protein
MNPNYDAMSRDDLRAYVLEHRDDLAAIKALFSRPKADRAPIKFPFPDTDAEWQRQVQILQPYLDQPASSGG